MSTSSSFPNRTRSCERFPASRTSCRSTSSSPRPGTSFRSPRAGRSEARSPSAWLTFRHFDPYSQALAKLERNHARDRSDVRSLVSAGLVDPARLWGYFREIEPALYRFPAIDPAAFRARVEQARTLGHEHGRGIER